MSSTVTHRSIVRMIVIVSQAVIYSSVLALAYKTVEARKKPHSSIHVNAKRIHLLTLGGTIPVVVQMNLAGLLLPQSHNNRSLALI